MPAVPMYLLASCSVLINPARSGEPQPDPLETVPEIIGARLRRDVPVTPVAGATCDGAATSVTVARSDVPVLTWTGAAGTWKVLDPPADGAFAAGEARLPTGMSVGVHRACVVTPDGVAAVDLKVDEAPYTQVSLQELNPDGTHRWRSVSAEVVRSATTSRQWVMSDFAHHQSLRDEQGRALAVPVQHDRSREIYSFDATLAEPAPPGSILVLDQRGLSDPFGIEEVGPGEFGYSFTHSPSAGVPTRRVEVFRLPAGATLVDQQGFDVVREREGRTELVKTVTVASGGTVTTSFRYHLEGASIPSTGPRVVESVPSTGATDVDPRLRELRVTFDADMVDGSWSWVQVDPATYPKSTDNPRYVDARTCVLPVKLRPDTEYVVWINKGRYDSFRDEAGRPAKAFELRFRTARR